MSGHRGTQIQCGHREGAAPRFKTHSRHGHTGTCPVLLLGWQRQKVTSAAHGPHCPGSKSTRIPEFSQYGNAPCASPALLWGFQLPLPASWVPDSLLGAHCTHTALTHSSYRHPTLTGSSEYQHRPSALTPLPGQGHPTHLAFKTGVTLLHVNGPFYTLFCLHLLCSSLIYFPCTVAPHLV